MVTIRTVPTALLTAATVLAVWTPAPVEAQNRRVRLLVNGLYNSTSQSFTDAVTFTSFLEDATSNRDYDLGTGFVFEAGAIFGITSSLGVMGSFEIYDGSMDAAFRESLPHPLFFDRPRSLEGEVTELSYREQAIHVDAVFTRDLSPSVTVDLFGGPTFFFTSSEVISSVTSTSKYPFDEVQLGTAQTVEVDDNPIGFNLGGAFTYRFTPVFGVAFHARYSQASISVTTAGGGPIELDAGGFRAGGGIRIAF